MSQTDEAQANETFQSSAPKQDDIRTLLAAHPFLIGWEPRHVDLLAVGATLEERTKGDLIFKQGDQARRFYLIVSGSVVLTHAGLNSNIHIQTLSGGDVLGWSWLFPPFAWHFNAMVIDTTRLIVLDGESIRSCAARDHDFGYELMGRISQVVIQRLQVTRKKFYKLAGG